MITVRARVQSSDTSFRTVQNLDGSWGTETERLLLMDSRDFNRIGIGVDDLIEAYMQV